MQLARQILFHIQQAQHAGIQSPDRLFNHTIRTKSKPLLLVKAGEPVTLLSKNVRSFTYLHLIESTYLAFDPGQEASLGSESGSVSSEWLGGDSDWLMYCEGTQH